MPARLLEHLRVLVDLAADQRAHAGRDVDHRVPVAGTGLEQDHRRAALRQPRGDDAAGRAGTDHDIVRLHVFLPRSLVRALRACRGGGLGARNAATTDAVKLCTTHFWDAYLKGVESSKKDLQSDKAGKALGGKSTIEHK